MAQGIILQALDRPATCVTIILQIAIFVKIHSARFDYADVGASYDVSFVGNDLSKDHLEKIDIVVLLAVVTNRQLWRLLTSQLSHISLLHLLMNAASLWNISNFAEGAADSGTIFYITHSLLLLTLSAVGFVLLYTISVKLLKRQQDAFVTCVGYSSVIFGWMAYLAVTAGSTMSMVVFGMAIPSHVYPWAALVFTSIIIPQASFVGHLAGILAGYVVGAITDYIDSMTCLVVFGVFLGLIIASTFYNQLDVVLGYVQSIRQWFSGSNIGEDDSVELTRLRRLRNLDTHPNTSTLPV